MYKRLKRLPFELTHPYRGTTFTIELPANYQILFDAIDNRRNLESDYKNSVEMLCFFLDLYDKLSDEERIEFQDLANCGVARTDTTADLLKLLLERHKYYRLYNVPDTYTLGKSRIKFMQKEYPESEIAKIPYRESYRVGEMIKEFQRGVFYKNDYYGLFDCYAQDKDDD